MPEIAKNVTTLGCEIDYLLLSGRRFTYEMEPYDFGVTKTKAEAELLAEKVIVKKYRYCQWDREHPKDNQELEIYLALVALFLQLSGDEL